MASPPVADALDLLRASSLFDPLSDEELQALIDRLGVAEFGAGDPLVLEGEHGDECYILREGQAVVVVSNLIDQKVTLAILGPGASFGESALVTGHPRTATVRALTAVAAWVLRKDDFDWLARVSPAFAEHARRHVDLLSIDRFLKQASPFSGLPRESLWRLTGRMERRLVRRGETIIREGEEGDCFYLIQSGRVEVLRNRKRLAVLETGDSFGEVALLAAVRRTATVRALEDTEVLALAGPDFDAVVQGDHTLGHHFRELVRIRFRAAPGQALALPDPVTTFMPFLEVHRRQRYWVLLLGGAAVFVVLTLLALLGDAPALVYAALVVGAFVGPIVYVTYLAESNILTQRLATLVGTFALAAALGLPIAIYLERQAGILPGQLGPALLVALIEEPAKVLGVLWLLHRRPLRFQMDGVISGAAAGMGFAAFESLLFGLARVEVVDELLLTLWLRTLLAPLGHGTWTAVICATIWREKGADAPRWNRQVAAAFGVAVLLHGLWDWRPLPGLLNVPWLLVVGAIGVVILRAVIHRAIREERTAVLALNPDVALGRPRRSPRMSCRACGQTAPADARYCPRCGLALKARGDGSASSGAKRMSDK